jgi:hypothetical protein
MDMSSGLKECPRCGLRNRRGAYQCDFCGWDFKAASDDWMGKVNDLEKIGREVEVTDIDKSTRSKIELTMKRPTDMAPREKKPEKQLEVPAHLTLEDQGDVETKNTDEPIPVVEVESTTYPESEAAEKIMAPILEPQPEAVAPPQVEDAPSVKVETPNKTTNMPLLLTISLVVAGLAMYAADLYLTMTHALGRIEGWEIAIAASALLAFAIMRLLPMLKKGAGEEELVLCPVCHEVVTEAAIKCPSCGVKFKETSSRE